MGPHLASLEGLRRLLLGDAPLAFLLEVLLRSVLIYALLLGVVRLLGRRMSGQITNLELAVMISLGAIVSVPIQIPERGLLPGALLLGAMLALHRGLSAATTRWKRVNEIASGTPRILVLDGMILPDQLGAARISHEQLFSALRNQGVRHLGQVKRVYFEACGMFTVLRAVTPHAGLSVLPRFDNALQSSETREHQHQACTYCGSVRSAARQGDGCDRCGRADWTDAAGQSPAPGSALELREAG